MLSIDNYTQLALEGYPDKLDARARNLILQIRSSVHEMAEIMKDLLNLSQVTRVELNRERVDLSEMVRRIAMNFQLTEPDRQVEFCVPEGIILQADPGFLRVVLVNLLSNAWKFTSNCPSAKIEVGALRQNGETVYFVRDNGAGFDMAYAGRLFGAFQRLHSSSEFEGTGVGLATVQRIIQGHGGRIWAEATRGQGATFYFTILVHQSDHPHAALHALEKSHHRKFPENN